MYNSTGCGHIITYKTRTFLSIIFIYFNFASFLHILIALNIKKSKRCVWCNSSSWFDLVHIFRVFCMFEVFLKIYLLSSPKKKKRVLMWDWASFFHLSKHHVVPSSVKPCSGFEFLHILSPISMHQIFTQMYSTVSIGPSYI